MVFRLFKNLTSLTRTISHSLKLKEEVRRMPRLSVRSVTGEERMQITFVFSAEGEPGSGAGKERVFNFDRLHNEELGKTLQRINANIAKIVNKKKKKNKSPTNSTGSSPEDIAVELYQEERKVDENILNSAAWKDGSKLLISSTWYTIQVNPPTIKNVILPEVIMVGFPIYPKIEAEFVDLSKCILTWYREEMDSATGDLTPSSGSATDLTREIPRLSCEITNRDWKVGTPVQPGEVKLSISEASGLSQTAAESDSRSHSQTPSPSVGTKLPKKGKRKLNGSMTNLNWVEIKKDLVYTPIAGDVGHKLRLVCTPCDGTRVGDDTDVVSTDVIQGPGRCPFEDRHNLTKTITEKGCFRVVTYNILADLYADSDYSRDFLFPHCPTYALQADYRKQILIKELIGYHGDIVCLQEVDRRLFTADLAPTLEQVGLEGRLKLKTGESAEGEAIFWRKDKFRCLGEHDLHLSEALQKDPLYQDLHEKIAQKETLLQKLTERKTILQVCMLESVEDAGQLVLVATTHLYFHPRAGHVRLIQTAQCLRHITSILDKYKAERGVEPAVVFCGDLNSAPNHGVYQLVLKGSIPSHHVDWYSGGRDEHLPNTDLRHPLKLTCASGTPAYTNFVAGFADCLDYVFINEQLQTSRVIPLPTHEDIARYSALPNPCFPSDHLALVCDILWR